MMIAVAGGKGGAGKTTAVVNLALAAAWHRIESFLAESALQKG